MVSFSPIEFTLRYAKVSATVLRWGAILLVEELEDFLLGRSSASKHGQPPPSRENALLALTCLLDPELAECLSLYPGIVFLAAPTSFRLSHIVQAAIDAEINCEPTALAVREPEQVSLWRHYLADELPELAKSLSVAQLSQACSKLALAEPRESRMEKTLRTAKRLALSEGVTVGLEHVMLVVRSSLTSQEAEEFDKTEH